MAWNEKIENEKSSGFNNKQQQKPLICICIPHEGNVTLEWAETTYTPLKYTAQPDFDKVTIISRGAPLDTTRNQMVKDALANPNVTHLLFVDSDMIPESPTDINQSLRQLLSLNAPIAGALYRAKQAQGNPYAMWMDIGDHNHFAAINEWIKGSNWIPVDVTGFGFILIKREVFEKIPEPWFVWDQIAPSEDFYFCMLAKKYGYETKVFTDVKFSHAGQMKVKTSGEVSVLSI